MTEIIDLSEGILGLTEAEAKQLLHERKGKLRVIKRDGREAVGDCSARPNRVNVEIEHGLIIRIDGIG